MNLIREAIGNYAKDCDFPFEELVQEGHLAICKAVKAHDPSRGASLEWYVKIVLRNHLLRITSRRRPAIEPLGDRSFDDVISLDREQRLSDRFDLQSAVDSVSLTKDEELFWLVFKQMDGERGSTAAAGRLIGVSRETACKLRDSVIGKMKRACERQMQRN